jgi:O-antigen/teichoic acid export membrane protein
VKLVQKIHGDVKSPIQWIQANYDILLNTGSLLGSTVITSGLGFAYWWLAARDFSPQDVGIGSASISAMMLIGTMCMMGLGTLLITELPRRPEQAASLISTALVVVSVIGGCVGCGFALVAPSMSASFLPLRTNISTVLLFALGVSLTSATLVLDQAVIGLLKGEIQLWRNGLFALGKFVVLFFVSRWFSQTAGMGIYGAWAVGNLISLIVLARFVSTKKQEHGKGYLPQWTLLRKLGGVALQHHLLNLVLSAPVLILPVMVAVMLSAQANAWFYIAWMVANFVFMVPGALTMVLHAVNSAQQATLKQRVRMTLSLAFAVSLVGICVIVLAANQLLSLFGSAYAAEAHWTLQILAIAVLPIIIKNHYMSICRIYDRITQALIAMIPSSLLELGIAALGAHIGGLVGLSVGWVIAMFIESIFMLPTIYTTIFSAQSSNLQQTEMEPIWLMDTVLMPSMMGGGYTGVEPIWLTDTVLLPLVRSSVKREDRKKIRKVRIESLHS